MEPAVLGLVLDSSVLIAAERRNRTAAQAVESVLQTIGEIPIVLSAISVAEIGHGIYRANTSELRGTFFLDFFGTRTSVPRMVHQRNRQQE